MRSPVTGGEAAIAKTANPGAGGGPDRFWARPLADLEAELATAGDGLSAAEAAARLKRYGPNQLERPSSLLGFFSLLHRATNPLVVVLLVASVVSAFVGEYVNAAIIALMVLFSGALDAYQTRRSQRAADQLRRRVESQATVKRDGAWIEVPLHDVVPGDLLRLRTGDLVPADARVLRCTSLVVDEATFTGESLPVEKKPIDVSDSATPAGALNTVFMGTVVGSGSAEVLAVRTGPTTTFAQLARVLQQAAPTTAFDHGLHRFGLLIARTVVVLVVFVLVVNLLDHRSFLDSLLFAVALAVGLTPEFLPMILSVTQAEGALRMAKSRVIVRQLAAIQNLGNMDIICSDKTGTLTEGRMAVERAVGADGKASDRVLLLAHINATMQTDMRSAFDEALAAQAVAGAEAYRSVGVLPFDFQRRRFSVAAESGSDCILVTKGAPESVLEVCSEVASGDQPAALDAATRQRLATLADGLGEQGFRLLAVATRPLTPGQALTLTDEAGMRFEGIIAFSDPPKGDIIDVLASLHEDGIRLVILTGDAEAVTRHVCGLIGLPVDRIITGEMLTALDDATLAPELERSSVFARVAPEQKLRVIKLLQHSGHVVGYLGDGINDAPALRAADVGISVAEAVDIAREAAQIVLLEKSLSVLHDGILEGRKVFGNVMKYIMMGTSSNFGNMLSMAAAVLFLPFLPLLPSQVLINNALYDLAQISIPSDHVDAAMVLKPRGWDMRFIRDFMLIFGPISSAYDFLTFYVLRHVFGAGETLFHTGWFVESLATQTLVIFVIRTVGNPLHSRPSGLLTATVVGVAAFGALLPWSPLAGPIGFDRPPAGFVIYVVVAAASYLVLVEATKRLFYRLHPLGERGERQGRSA